MLSGAHTFTEFIPMTFEKFKEIFLHRKKVYGCGRVVYLSVSGNYVGEEMDAKIQWTSYYVCVCGRKEKCIMQM